MPLFFCFSLECVLVFDVVLCVLMLAADGISLWIIMIKLKTEKQKHVCICEQFFLRISERRTFRGFLLPSFYNQA